MASSSATISQLKEVSDKVNFSAEEDKVLKYWEEIKAFETSLKQSEDEKRPVYTFYDGPPFATGLPHYGHILAGTIKDTVTRYAHQTGHHVVRRFGWDCHGLPVEYEIDQKLGIKSKDDVFKMGVAAYNSECRSIVQRYAGEWETRVKRLGRWIDFKNDYKTMNASFMESVWWVFKTLFDKQLVYRGFKVMPYSWACNTPLSNFEANSNYKEVSDPAVIITFPWLDEPNTNFLAWTTTPWTLPSNLAVALHPKYTYVKVKDVKTGKLYVLLKSRLGELYVSAKKAASEKKDTDTSSSATASTEKSKGGKDVKETAKEYEILEEMLGETLANKRYKPLFDYFYEEQKANAYRSVLAEYVTEDSGVGIVHQAPAFGEDDYDVCLKNGIIQKGFNILCPVDDNGRFTAAVRDFAGRNVKEADKDIIAYLKKNDRLVSSGSIVHQYPFCWRSETPLIYRAVPSWFVKVEQIKEQLVKCNEQTYWVPEFVKVKRFHNWLQDAKDWAISRNRFWGTPIPIWMSDDAEEIVVVGSIEELKKLSGVNNIEDLHKDKIDHITIPSRKGKGQLKRIPEDCWFESGSMPYAQLHYPFENKEFFEGGFPADFIAEGLDQTRGWFYTLMVISTALYNKPAFKNLIVNGLVLASDGKKMSKRLKNYPDPMDVVARYGADALRLYLISSPAVRAEPLRFQEAAVHDLIKRVFLPWFHAYRFFVENALRYEHSNRCVFTANPQLKYEVTNVMDSWILSSLQSLISFVHEEMKAYRLYTVVPRLLSFIENLTNWYVRMNRKRLKGRGDSEQDTLLALNTLFEVLITLCRLMAPFTPFLVEMMYHNLKLVLPASQRAASVHFLLLPEKDEKQIKVDIERAVSRMQSVVEDGRNARDKRNISLKQPLRRLLILHRDKAFLNDIKSLAHYIAEEVNVQQVELETEVSKWALLKADVVQKLLGPRVGKKLKAIKDAAALLTHEQIENIQKESVWKIEGEEIKLDELEIRWEFKTDKKEESKSSNSTATETVKEEGKENKKDKAAKAKEAKAKKENDKSEQAQSVYQPSQEKGAALVILDCTYDVDLIQQYVAREVINRIQRLRKTAGLSPTDPIEIFYSFPNANGKESKEVEAAIVAQSILISQTVTRPIYPLEQLPPHAIIIAEQQSDINDSNILITIIRPTLFFAIDQLNKLVAAVSDVPANLANSVQLYLLNKEWAAFEKATAAAPSHKLRLDGKELTVQRNVHFFFTAQEYFAFRK